MAEAKRKSAPKKSGAGSVSSVLALAKQTKMVDFKFVDLPGIWQHFSIPASELEADMSTDGLGFDGSSICGWQGIEESDMLVMPDPSTALIDPFMSEMVLTMIECGIDIEVHHHEVGTAGQAEIDIRMRPHPYEFSLYYDI